MDRVINFDGHVWTDRGDGVYFPDVEYTINDTVWGSGKEFDEKTFVLTETGTDSIYLVRAMSVSAWDTYKAARYRAELNKTEQRHSITMDGFYDERSMGELKYVIQ